MVLVVYLLTMVGLTAKFEKKLEKNKIEKMSLITEIKDIFYLFVKFI